MKDKISEVQNESNQWMNNLMFISVCPKTNIENLLLMSQRYYEKACLMIMQEIHVILKRCQFIRDRNKMRKIHIKMVV